MMALEKQIIAARMNSMNSSLKINKENVINSCSKILSTAEHVYLAEDYEFESISKSLMADLKLFDAFKQWKANELNPKAVTFNKYTADWIFLCDLLNFSFWKDETGPSFDVEFNGKVYSNYWSLPATLNKHSDLLVNPKFYSKITATEFDQIFNPNIPLKEERIRLMNEAGRVLVDKYDGSFYNFLTFVGSKDAWHFINCLLDDFPSFLDINEELSVFFLKRAQILVADLWAASEGSLFTETIKDLTIFADYRIPQVLWSMGLIKYRPDLQEKLKNKEILPSGSVEEAEIRAASIISCEKLKSLLNCRNAVELDFYLWEQSQKIKKEIDSIYPFHRTRSIYY